jgi:hypothetical protein
VNRSNKQRYRLQSGFHEIERPKYDLVNSVHRDVYAIVHSQASRDAFTARTHPLRVEVTFGPHQGRRPKYLSPNALYIERAVVPFKLSSTPGDWLDCWFDENEQLDHCKMTDDKGNPEFEDVFLPYEGQSPVSQDKLVFDTGRGGIWIGSYEKGFPIVYLTNGEILLPRSEFEKAKQTVDWSKGRRSSP